LNENIEVENIGTADEKSYEIKRGVRKLYKN
jgi:hypothetical protein